MPNDPFMQIGATPLGSVDMGADMDARVNSMLAHAHVREISKDVAKDLLFAEAHIETERLLMRPISLDDYDAYAEMVGDPDCFTYGARGPMGSDEAFTRLLRQAGHWALLDYGQFAVFEKSSGKFVGEVGFGDYRRNFGEHFDPFPEASWVIKKPYQRKGYAYEAAKAALDFTEDRLIAARTVCLIHHENLVSIHIARKLGYKAYDERVYRGYRAMLFARECQ